ncbi:hypothetical protein HYC85_022478 [Camellia sinensis]|uniref:Pectinesterase catalytic domain-containing protein n=1 Tax=Camellia sinensis TaxID=4442 RepID=A0A7J7GN45_CAMSI|nr:hypothetical protein HYC85_022478 [Camellia sinensis]
MESKFASSSSIVFIVVVFFFLCLTRTTISIHTNIIFNVTVAQGGSGNYKRINDAIVATPMHISYYIRVKPGVYSENVVVEENKTNIALIGNDAATTKIIGNQSNATGFGIPQFATMTCMVEVMGSRSSVAFFARADMPNVSGRSNVDSFARAQSLVLNSNSQVLDQLSILSLTLTFVPSKE